MRSNLSQLNKQWFKTKRRNLVLSTLVNLKKLNLLSLKDHNNLMFKDFSKTLNKYISNQLKPKPWEKDLRIWKKENTWWRNNKTKCSEEAAEGWCLTCKCSWINLLHSLLWCKDPQCSKTWCNKVEIEEWETTNIIKEETTTETKEETEAEVITNKDTITTEEIIITIIIKVQVSKDNSSEMDKAETKEVTDHNKWITSNSNSWDNNKWTNKECNNTNKLRDSNKPNKLKFNNQAIRTNLNNLKYLNNHKYLNKLQHNNKLHNTLNN